MNRSALHRAAALAAALLGACGGPEPVLPGPQPEQVQLADAEIRAIAQLLRYEDQRTFDREVFDRLAGNGEEVRGRVALAAGRIGDPAAVPLLARLLDDDRSAAVRADAAFALGELGDTSRVVMASLREAVPPGWVPVRPAETAVAVEVLQALGKLGTFEGRAMVLDALRAAHLVDSDNARAVAAEALLSIWRFNDGPGRVSGVVRYLDAHDAELRWRAAYALMRLGEPDGVRRLLPLLSDPDHRVREYAARGLAPPAVDTAGVRDSAIVGLDAALADEHPHVRINAVRALGAYGDDAPVDSMVVLLSDRDPAVAIAAANALAAFPERARTALIAVAANRREPYALRTAAARAVAPAAPDTIRAQLRAWADSGFTARYAAARALSAGPAPDPDLVRRLVDDPDIRVVVAALVAAGEIGADSTAPPATRSVVRSLLRTRAEGEGRAAIVALRSLAALADSAGGRQLLARAEAREGALAGAQPTRDAAFYEDVVRTYVGPILAGQPRPRATIRTRGGEIVVELLGDQAPLTVRNFVSLARAGFWDDGVWHRVIPNFVIQDGAPAGDPEGGPGWSIRDEINRVRYARGIMGMALSGPDTGGSQWFITLSPQHHLDGGYTVFGRVVDGMVMADAVLQGDPIQSVRVP